MFRFVYENYESEDNIKYDMILLWYDIIKILKIGDYKINIEYNCNFLYVFISNKFNLRNLVINEMMVFYC